MVSIARQFSIGLVSNWIFYNSQSFLHVNNIILITVVGIINCVLYLKISSEFGTPGNKRKEIIGNIRVILYFVIFIHGFTTPFSVVGIILQY